MFALIGAAGAAAAMYFFDPDSGERRRALLRDKFAWLRDEFGDVRETAEGRIEHIGNVAKGLAHESGIRPMTPKQHDTQQEMGAALNASSMGDTHREDSQSSSRAA